ncbi:MAG: hypothetical protein HQL76_02280 [Magnetococcales bacterium]|nr:hypothetical protein [Magnetococcales bacterium]
MEIIYFTLAGILLYWISDVIVRHIERKRGALLPNRSLVFFAIILVLTMALFQTIQTLVPTATDTGQAPSTSPNDPLNKK